jgi:hypothetical protein
MIVERKIGLSKRFFNTTSIEYERIHFKQKQGIFMGTIKLSSQQKHLKGGRQMEKKKDPLLTEFGRCGFMFSEEEMKELIVSYYTGANDEYASRLQRLDNQDHLQKCKAITLAPSKKSHPNSLLQKFSHDDVGQALNDIDDKEGYPKNWHEYCLKVWAGRENPCTRKNQGKPKLEDADFIEALVLFSQQLIKQEKKVHFNKDFEQVENLLNALL